MSEADKLLKALVDSWEITQPYVDNIFLIQHARTGVGYLGPNDFADALTAAREYLKETNK